MSDFLLSEPFQFIMWIISLVVAITIHEFAHAYTAEKLGDPTPRLMGRLTLNPLAHLDPIGTLMLLLIRFGWGKPVQFDPFNLKNPRRDAALISIAGPVSNIILASFLSIILRLPFSSPIVFAIIAPIVYLNILLAVFNLLPIHPLDGFKIVGGILSEDQSKEWHSLEKYGFIFLLILILPIRDQSLLSSILNPIIKFLIPLFLGPSGMYV